MRFIYAGVPSQAHELIIASFDSSGYRYAGGSRRELITGKPPRSQRHILLGAVPKERLEFDLEIVSTNGPIHPRKMRYIKAWLCGQPQFQPLYIQHPDFADYYFNCLCLNPEDICVDGYNGLRVTVSCDAGGAWSNRKSKTWKLPSGGNVVFANESDDGDYLYPNVSFKLTGSATAFSITNRTDANRVFSFSGLTAKESITVNGDTGEIISPLGINRLPSFNKNYLRLLPGANALQLSAGAEQLTLEYRNFIRLGG